MVCYQVDILAIFARLLPNRLELLLLGWKSSTGARLSSRTESMGQELLRGGHPSSKGKGNFPFCIFTTTVLKKKLHYVCCTKMSKPRHAISSFPYCNPHSGQTPALKVSSPDPLELLQFRDSSVATAATRTGYPFDQLVVTHWTV